MITKKCFNANLWLLHKIDTCILEFVPYLDLERSK